MSNVSTLTKKFKSAKYEIWQEYTPISACKYFTNEFHTGYQKRKDPTKDDSVVEDCKKNLYNISWNEHIVRYVNNILSLISKFKIYA